MKKGDVVWAWNSSRENAHLVIFRYKDGPFYFCNYNPIQKVPFQYKYVEPYNPIRIVKDPVSIMKILIKNGYEYVPSRDQWSYEDVDLKWSFKNDMWQYCGKEKPDFYCWEPEWLEAL